MPMVLPRRSTTHRDWRPERPGRLRHVRRPVHWPHQVRHRLRVRRAMPRHLPQARHLRHVRSRRPLRLPLERPLRRDHRRYRSWLTWPLPDRRKTNRAHLPLPAWPPRLSPDSCPRGRRRPACRHVRRPEHPARPPQAPRPQAPPRFVVPERVPYRLRRRSPTLPDFPQPDTPGTTATGSWATSSDSELNQGRDFSAMPNRRALEGGAAEHIAGMSRHYRAKSMDRQATFDALAADSLKKRATRARGTRGGNCSSQPFREPGSRQTIASTLSDTARTELAPPSLFWGFIQILSTQVAIRFAGMDRSFGELYFPRLRLRRQ